MSRVANVYAAEQDTKHASDNNASKINVLVYSGPGVSQSCLLHLKTALSKLLSTRYDVLSISAESLIRDPWTSNCALLAFPGGRDLGYLSSLGELGCARIADWVRNQGGRYLGLCAGAYFASDRIEFESGREGFEVIGDRPLKFFPGACKGTAFPNFVYDSEDGARDAIISLEGPVCEQVWLDKPRFLDIYYNGGGYFDEPDDERVQVIARYEELESKPPAGVVCRVGEHGKALLWGVHPEHPSTMASSTSSSPNSLEEPRTALLRASLRLLDLEVPDRARVPTDPTPLILTALEPSDAEQLGYSMLSALPTAFENGGHQDLTSIFHFHKQDDIAAVFGRTSPAYHTRQDVVICSQSVPGPSLTPIFNLQTYFAQLASARKALKYAYKPSFGSELMYGEVVTSTQTVLDK
jgi:biotin--protein ligase